MSVYKPFITSDIVVSPFELNKFFSYNNLAALTGSGLDLFVGENTPFELFPSGSNLTGYINPINSYLLYNSIKHLYYSNFLENINGSEASLIITNIDGTLSGSATTTNFDNYLSTTLPAQRTFPTGSGKKVGVLSIPSNVFGEYVQPNSFKWESALGIITDDGEGRLYYSGSFGEDVLIGNIIYEHGIATLDGEVCENLDGYHYVSYTLPSPPIPVGIYGGIFKSFIPNFTNLEFNSSITIYESQYKCTIRENEFNFSSNPTLAPGSGIIFQGGYDYIDYDSIYASDVYENQNNTYSGELYGFVTSSYFSPYVTTVGMYNNKKELLAVAKLAQPLPLSPTTDTSIIINLDI